MLQGFHRPRSEVPPPSHKAPHTRKTRHPPTTIYFNGLCAINKKGEAGARSDLWYSENDEWNVALRIDLKNPTH